METRQPTGVVVRGPDQGQATWAMGSLFERLVSGRETRGAFDLTLATQPPGIAPPLHVHAHEAEAFYVLEGTMGYRAGEDFHHLAAGSSSTSHRVCRTRSASPEPRPRDFSVWTCQPG